MEFECFGCRNGMAVWGPNHLSLEHKKLFYLGILPDVSHLKKSVPVGTKTNKMDFVIVACFTAAG